MPDYDLEPGRRRLLDEYDEAENYDAEDPSDTGIAFYTALAQETGGPVLELGCGTGRAAIPLAQLGFDVTGLEVVPGMLDVARRKPEGVSVHWLEADARDFDIGRQFRLIFLTGNTFQAFLSNTDQSAMLECAHRHLHSSGLLAFETRNPRWAIAAGDTKASPAVGDERGAFALLETREDEEEGPSYVDADGHQVRVFRTQVYDHVTQVLRWTAEHRWYEDGELRTKRRQVDVRFTFPQELVALLEHHGFEVVRRYGDWNLEPLTESSRSIIVVCRKRS